MYTLDEILVHGDWCVRCRKEEESISLLSELDARGMRWSGGDSYLRDNKWIVYEERTVYYIADGMFSDIEYAEAENDTIIDFCDVLLEKQPALVLLTFEDVFGGLSDD